MDAPATPGASSSPKDQIPTAAPATPDNSRHASRPYTPHHTHSPFAARTPRTPGSAALDTCTVDEPLFTKVSVHTAKCTECDKRNMDTMRRCPGCTFQVCQPCYEKRQREGKGLVHGSMPTPGATGGMTSIGSGARTTRKKPVSNVLYTGSPQSKTGDVMQESPAEDAAAGKERESTKPATGEYMARKPRSEKSHGDKYSRDDSESDDAYRTPSKRRRTDLSFAESAFATALREPPATRASQKPDLAAFHQALASAPLEPRELQSSARYVPGEHLQSGILYQQAIQNYDEPLLARREPVLSNPAAHIPAIVKRGGQPKPSAEQIYKNIQDKLAAKMCMDTDSVMVPDEALSKMAVQCNEENNGQAYTVRAYVEKEASRYQDYRTLDEDDNKALFHTLENAALMWGKRTYSKLDPGTQRTLRPGLNLRLDCIDPAYTEELKALMAELAASALQGLAGFNTACSMSPQPPSSQ